ncbi:MAG: hypothetical protein KKE53_12445 [Proteobacteria bacterium]|nr:hypothetical protein [Pseudomonadota bacterium]
MLETEKVKKLLKGWGRKAFPRSRRGWLNLLGPEEADTLTDGRLSSS